MVDYIINRAAILYVLENCRARDERVSEIENGLLYLVIKLSWQMYTLQALWNDFEKYIMLILIDVFSTWWCFIIFIFNLLSTKCIEACKRFKKHALVKCKHHYSEKTHDLLWSTNKSTTMYRAGIVTLSIILKLMVGRVFALVAYYCCWNYWRCASKIEQIFHNRTQFVFCFVIFIVSIASQLFWNHFDIEDISILSWDR